MTLDSKTVQTHQQIEKDRQELLAQLLAERYGAATHPDNADKSE